MLPGWRAVAALFLVAALAGCDNSPLPLGAAESNTLYTAMSQNTPRHLDPTASYWSNDTPSPTRSTSRSTATTT